MQPKLHHPHSLNSCCGRVFGSAGDRVVVEACLTGDEVSLMAFSDGARIACMPPARDYKRYAAHTPHTPYSSEILFLILITFLSNSSEGFPLNRLNLNPPARLLSGDGGPNTGGMGAIAPVPRLSPAHLSSMQAIMQTTVTALAHEGRPFVGVLYGGFMLPRRSEETEVETEVEVDTEDGPQVLEFNCRMGDPETQSVLSLLDADLLSIMKQVGRLSAQIIF